jgi:DNA replication protein DnaC
MHDLYVDIAKRLNDLGVRIEECEVAAAAKESKADHSALMLTDRVLSLALQKKNERTVETLRKFSRIPVHKRLEDFDFSFQPTIDEKQIRRLATLGFVHTRENILLIGPPGCGKSHLAISFAELCIDQGMRAYYITMSDLAMKLAEAKKAGKLKRVMASLMRPSLLVIDELGYDHLDLEASELIFKLVAARYEQKSIVVTSNFPISRWSEVFGSDALTQVIADRLIHHAEIINIKGKSYRLKDRL